MSTNYPYRHKHKQTWSHTWSFLECSWEKSVFLPQILSSLLIKIGVLVFFPLFHLKGGNSGRRKQWESSWILTIVQNCFTTQINKSLVCTILLDVCNLLEMWPLCTRHKWNYESVIKCIISTLPTAFPITHCWFWKLPMHLKWKVTIETTEYPLLLKNNNKKPSYEALLNGISSRRQK